jgi:hypothetical protein
MHDHGYAASRERAMTDFKVLCVSDAIDGRRASLWEQLSVGRAFA